MSFRRRSLATYSQSLHLEQEMSKCTYQMAKCELPQRKWMVNVLECGRINCVAGKPQSHDSNARECDAWADRHRGVEDMFQPGRSSKVWRAA